MKNPSLAPVMSGTGGLRKLRFAPRRWKRGKRGAIRVCYAYFPRHYLILLVMAYSKAEKDNLARHEKLAIKTYLQEIEAWLDRERRHRGSN